MDWWAQQGIEGLLPNETRVPFDYRNDPNVAAGGVRGNTGYGGGSAPAPTGGDPRTAIMAILQRYPPGSASLEQAMPEIQRLFPGTRFDTSGGPKDEIVIPGYGLVDVGGNFESDGAKSWTWQTSAPGTRTGAGGSDAIHAGVYTGGGKYPLASVMGPGLMRPWDTPFKAPTMEQVRQSPGYATRLKAGQEAIERSAASKGTLLTGGTAKDLTQFGQDYGQNAYDTEYNRALGEYQQAYGIYNNNGTTQYNRLSGMVNQGGQAASAGAGVASQFGQQGAGTYQGIGNAQAAGQAASGAAWGGAVQGAGSAIGGAYTLGSVLRQSPMAAPRYPQQAAGGGFYGGGYA